MHELLGDVAGDGDGDGELGPATATATTWTGLASVPKWAVPRVATGGQMASSPIRRARVGRSATGLPCRRADVMR